MISLARGKVAWAGRTVSMTSLSTLTPSTLKKATSSRTATGTEKPRVAREEQGKMVIVSWLVRSISSFLTSWISCESRGERSSLARMYR